VPVFTCSGPLWFGKHHGSGQGHGGRCAATKKHPGLYASLIKAQPRAVSSGAVLFAEDLKKYGISPDDAPELLWSSEKFLVSPSGEVVARFARDTKPDDPALIAAVEAELARG